MRLRMLALVLPIGLVAALGGSAAGAQADTLLSQGKSVIASSIEDEGLAAAKAVDGSTSTRWASAEGSDPQWIRVDLGQPASVGRVKLNWEAAYAKAYRIEVSDDGTSFRTVREVADGNGAVDDLTGLQAHGRYVRLVGTKRGTSYGYSLWELQVYGTPDSAGDTQAPTVPAGCGVPALRRRRSRSVGPRRPTTSALLGTTYCVAVSWSRRRRARSTTTPG